MQANINIASGVIIRNIRRMKFLNTKTVLCSILVAGLQLTTSVDARTFTDRAGNEFEASIASTGELTVTLLIPAKGRVYKVPIAKLSDGDQNYIKEYKKKKILGLDTGSSGTSSTEGRGARTLLPQKNSLKKPQKVKKSPSSGVSKVQTGAAKLKAQHKLVDNYLTSWPTIVETSRNLNIKTASEDASKKRYVYHSPNYEFICDVPLPKTVVQKFATMFEATRELCRKLPISSMKAHVPGSYKRHKILLFERDISYYKNGGVPGSAGIYRSSDEVIMVPFSSLGLKKAGGNYVNDYNGSNSVLAHEIVHQLTDKEYFKHGAQGWFSEGLAEYCAITPYKGGKYVVRGNISNIVAYVTAYGKDNKAGRNLGKKFDAPDLRLYMLQSYSSFSRQGNYNYGLGALVTYYFFHMESDRRNVTSFLKALKAGKTGEEALKSLLNGRSFDKLEADISRAWKAKGVEINFL